MKTVVIEVCGSMLVDVYTDDPVFVLLVDWDSEGYEPGDCYVRQVKDGDQDRLVLAVPGYPTTPLAAAENAIIALGAPVHHRRADPAGRDSLAQNPLANGSGDLRRARVETHERVAQRGRARRPKRLGNIEPRLVNCAEQSGDRGLLYPIRARNARNQCGEVLIPHLAGQQQQHHQTEAEGGLQSPLPRVA